MSNLKIDTPQIRKLNREQVFNYIKDNDWVTQADVKDFTGLSRPTIANILQELEEKNLISKRKNEEKTGGRMSMAFACNKNARYAIGIQLTNLHIKAVAVNMQGEILAQKQTEKKLHVDESYRRAIGDIYAEVVKEARIDESLILGCGITVQALTDVEGTRVSYVVTPDKERIYMEGLADYIPCKTRLFHDLNALGWNSALWTKKNEFYLSINNRIGSTILVDGNIYTGDHNRAGEIGHMLLVPNGKKCYCGNCGCFDAYCNTDNIKVLGDGDISTFFKKLDDGNKECEEFWEEYKQRLTDAIFGIHVTFDGTILIGGEIAQYRGYYYNEVCDALDKKAFFPEDRAREYLKVVEQGDSAIAVGAALYFIRNILDTFD